MSSLFKLLNNDDSSTTQLISSLKAEVHDLKGQLTELSNENTKINQKLDLILDSLQVKSNIPKHNFHFPSATSTRNFTIHSDSSSIQRKDEHVNHLHKRVKTAKVKLSTLNVIPELMPNNSKNKNLTVRFDDEVDSHTVKLEKSEAIGKIPLLAHQKTGESIDDAFEEEDDKENARQILKEIPIDSSPQKVRNELNRDESMSPPIKQRVDRVKIETVLKKVPKRNKVVIPLVERNLRSRG